MGGSLFAGLQVDDLGMGRLLCIPQILGDDVAHPGDLGELVADLGDREVEMLRTDEEDIVGRPLPHRFEETGHQLDQASGLLELLVLLEQRDDVLEPRVEGIGGGDLVGDRLGTSVGGLRLGGFFQLAAERFGNVFDLGLVGDRLEETFAQNVVDLVGGEVNRRDVALLAAQLGTGVFERPVDELGTRVVGGGKVRDHNADVLFLACSGQQVRKRAGRDVGDRAVADLLGVQVVEVRRHLIEENKNRLVALEELEPVLLVRCLGTTRPESPKLIALVELIGDLAPEEVIGVVAAIECGNGSGFKCRRVSSSAAVCLAEPCGLSEEAEANEKVSLTAAHGLFEVEHGLCRSAGEAGDALADQVLHALGDVRLFEEGRAIPLGFDQLIEPLDLVAELDGQRVLLRAAGVTDGFHQRTILVWMLTFLTLPCLWIPKWGTPLP